MLTVAQVVTAEQVKKTQTLFAEYFEFLRTDVDTDVDDLDEVVPMAGFREEMAGLPGKYAPPDGRLLLAELDGQAAGCVAFYKLDEATCEVKRLWARPQFRRMKVGRALMETLVAEARSAGFATILLSSADVLKEAHGLYYSLGFQPTEPFFEMPPEMLANELFMRLDLATRP